VSSLPEDPASVPWRPKRLWAPWWLALILGSAVGVTLTLLRASRAFVIPGAIILAAIIIVISVATILRRQFHAETLEPPMSLSYLLWMVLLIFLVGPTAVMLMPMNPQEIIAKALALSLGISICMYAADRALFSGFSRRGGPKQDA
jgi:CDP-diglyceride synthetase